MLIVHADVRTMEGHNYQDGYIWMQEGKIRQVGPMECAPHDEQVFDAKGAVAIPGLVDPHCHVGMWEDGLGFEGDDGNEDTDPCVPQLRGLDGVNPLDRSFSEALDYGVTTVVTGPGSANPISGQMLAMKTHGRRVDDMVIQAPLAIKMAFGENPKNTYHAKAQSPSTRMAIASIIREQLTKAQRYAKQMADAKQDEELDEPEYDAKCEALLPLLSRKIKAHIHAHRADDIFTAIRIAKEFDLDYVIVHGTDGHLIAPELAQEGTPVIAGPLLGARTKPELVNAQIAGAGVMARAGVPVALCSDHPELPCHYLLMSAQLAADAGLESSAALRAITIEAARICGIDDRVGSLAPGKDGDVVLYAGEPMCVREKPLAVFVGGVQVR